MKTQTEKWGRVLLPALCYLALHRLLRIMGAGTEICAWVIAPAAVLWYSREKKHTAGTLRLGSLRGAGVAAVTALAAALVNAWCFPGTGAEVTPGLLAATVIAGPIGEEAVYRGIVWDRGCCLLGRRQALVLSTVLFGLAHTGPAQMAAAAIFGAVLCLLRMRFRSIAVPILVHSFVNLLACLPVFGQIPNIVLGVAVAGAALLTLVILVRNPEEENIGQVP